MLLVRFWIRMYNYPNFDPDLGSYHKKKLDSAGKNDPDQSIKFIYY